MSRIRPTRFLAASRIAPGVLAALVAASIGVEISAAHTPLRPRMMPPCVLDCPTSNTGGSGGIAEMMMIAAGQPPEYCPDEVNEFTDVVDAASANALLCGHLATCEGDTVQSLGGSVMPAAAGGTGNSSPYPTYHDYRLNPRGLWEAFDWYCWYVECAFTYSVGDEDELVACQSFYGPAAPMTQETGIEEGEDFECECCPTWGGGAGGGAGPGGGPGGGGPGGSGGPGAGLGGAGGGGDWPRRWYSPKVEMHVPRPGPQSSNPVALASGHKLEDAVDLRVPLNGRDFVLTRHYTSSPDYTGASLAGNNWTLSAFGFIGQDGDDYILNGPALKNKVRFIKDPVEDEWFPRGTSNRYMVPGAGTTIGVTSYNTVRMVEPGAWACEYVDPAESGPYMGLMVKWEDAYGNNQHYSYLLHNGVARLRSIFLNGTDYDNCEAVVRFWWFVGGAGGNSSAGPHEDVAGKLHFVEVLRVEERTLTETKFVKTNQVTYTYRMPDDTTHGDVGSYGDLIMVAKKTPTKPGRNNDPWRYQITQYRYHTSSVVAVAEDERANTLGADHQLKLVIEPEQLEYFTVQSASSVEAAAVELLTHPDFVDNLPLFTDYSEPTSVDYHLLDLAAKIVGYDWQYDPFDPPSSTGTRRVVSQYLQSGCGCGGAAQGVQLDYAYTDGYTIGGLDGLTCRIIEKKLSGSSYTEHRRFYYDMLKLGAGEVPYLTTAAIVEPSPGSRKWVEHRVHASSGAPNVVKVATPSAVASYASVDDTSGAPTISFQESEGLVLGYTYTADNRLQEQRVHEGWGSSGSPVAVTSFDLVDRMEYHGTKTWLPAAYIRFRTVGQTTFTTAGNDHEVTTYEYGFVNSGDAQPQWVKITTEAELESENGPGGTYDSYLVFNDRGHLDWSLSADNVLTYRAYEPWTGTLAKIVRDADKDAPDGESGDALAGTLAGSLSTTSWGSATPAELVTSYLVDALGRTVRRTAPGGVHSYVTREMEGLYYKETTFPHYLGTLTTPNCDGPATMTWFNAGGKVLESVDRSIGVGPFGEYNPLELNFTLGSYLGRSQARYTLSGLVKERKVWDDVQGTYITGGSFHTTQYSYDELGRMAAQIAANGTITAYGHDVLNRVTSVAIGLAPGDTSATEPKTVAEYFYDDPDVSDGPDQGAGNGNLNYIRAHATASITRDTKRYFDYRDRSFKVVSPTSPHEFLVYDNLDRVVERAVFSSAPIDIDDPLGGRGMYSTTAYSQRGLVYRQQVAIDPTDSTPDFLESHTWYDLAGRPIAQWGPNAPATKTQYDAHGRPTLVALTDRGGDPAPGASANHASAEDLVGDIVLEQAHYAYTAAGRVDNILTLYRRHDEVLHTGELTDTKAVQTFVGHIYDAALRPIRTLNYGTNDITGDFFQNAALPAWPLDIETYGLPDWDANQPADDPIMSGVVYDERGLVRDGIDPLGRITRTLYDDLNRRIAVIENYDDAEIGWNAGAALPRWAVTGGLDHTEPDVDRVTSFVYDGAGNVVQQVAHQPDSGDDETVQVTRYVYGTRLSGSDWLDSLVASGDLLAAVHYPNESTGEADVDPEFTVQFAYNRLGELVNVIDQNGTEHAYKRDGAGRVTIDSVENFGTGIDQRVKSLQVLYDEFGRMKSLISRGGAGATGSKLNAVEFAYTPLWQVQQVLQDPDSDIDTGSPIGIPTAVLNYGYNIVNNGSRLAYMQYPSGGIDLVFGATGTNDTIHRIDSLSLTTGPVANLVAYSFLGMGMFAVVDYPTPDVQLDRTLSPDGQRNAMGHTTQDPGVYPGFDRFGRVKFHAWADGDLTQHGTTAGSPDRPFLVAEGYGYDAASNRKHKDTIQPVVGQNWNHVDWEYTYDGLDRLIEAKRGVWGGTSLSATAAGSQQWSLDMLGNWAAFSKDLDANGAYTDAADLAETRDHNAANEIVEIGQTYPGSATRPFAYDDAGNMTEQTLRSGEGTGVRTYVHDAWNRLVEVKLDADGSGSTYSQFTIARYEYNPLHWRTVKVADTRAPSSNPTTGPALTQHRVMYYDASWRIIEEHICDAWDDGEGTGDDNRVGQYFWGLRYIDDFVYRHEDRDLTNAAPPAEDPPEPDFDEAETPGWFALTDVQFSVVALITPTGRVAERVVYDPYGRARHYFPADFQGDADVDTADQNAQLSAWFADHLSADWTRADDTDVPDIFAYLTDFFAYQSKDAGAGQISWRYVPGVSSGPDNVIGYCGYVFNPETDDYTVRFRHYDPEIGRWLERDPAGYSDGSNLLEAARTSPINNTDPRGLLSIRPPGNGNWKDASEAAKARKSLQDALRRLCPTARVTASGMVYIEGDRIEEPAVEEKLSNDVREDGDCKDKCKDPPGCKILGAILQTFPDLIIEWGPGDPVFRWTVDPRDNKKKEGEYRRPDRQWIPWLDQPGRQDKRDKDGKLVPDRQVDGWEVLWHELIHAYHYNNGKHPGRKTHKFGPKSAGYAMEEMLTIDQMNELLEWYNACSKLASPPLTPRDPFGHGPATRNKTDKDRPWIQNPEPHDYIPFGIPGPNEKAK